MKVIELLDEEQAIVSTKDRCRIVLHKADGSEEIWKELVRPRRAMNAVQAFNFSWKPGQPWAEVVSYSSIFEREERERQREIRALIGRSDFAGGDSGDCTAISIEGVRHAEA